MQLLYHPVVSLRATVQALKMHPEEGALIVQHSEAVALIEANSAAAQLVLLLVVAGGGLRLFTPAAGLLGAA